MHTGGGERLHGLDRLRSVAIILVLLYHYQVGYGIPEPLAFLGLDAVARFGWSGVDLFFVLSGYLITDQLLADHQRTGRIRVLRFYARRALRILPAYLAVVAVYFSVPGAGEGRGLQPLWRFLSFTQNTPIDLRANSFSHAWSLCVEWQFYLALPLALAALSVAGLWRRGGYLILGVVVLGLVLRYAAWAGYVAPWGDGLRRMAALTHIYYATPVRLDGLAVGAAVAALCHCRPDLAERLVRHRRLLLAAGLLGLLAWQQAFAASTVARTFSAAPAAVLGFPLLSLAYGLVVASALGGSRAPPGVLPATVSRLAVWSYALYLIHKMVFHLVHAGLAAQVEPRGVPMFLICLAAAILAGAVLHIAVERPFLALRAQDRSDVKPACDFSIPGLSDPPGAVRPLPDPHGRRRPCPMSTDS